jgi:hypothetical protein
MEQHQSTAPVTVARSSQGGRKALAWAHSGAGVRMTTLSMVFLSNRTTKLASQTQAALCFTTGMAEFEISTFSNADCLQAVSRSSEATQNENLQERKLMPLLENDREDLAA